jgi:hypothetical protein
MAMVIEAVSGPRPSARDEAKDWRHVRGPVNARAAAPATVSPPRSEPCGGGSAIDAVELGNMLKYLINISAYDVAGGYGARR